MRASFALLSVALVLTATACAAVAAGEFPEGDSDTASSGSNRAGDDPVVSRDGGTTSPAPGDAEAGSWRGSPLCGDPSLVCMPDDPRRSPGCGNEASSSSGGPNGGSSSGESSSGDIGSSSGESSGEPTGGSSSGGEDEEDASSARARACRVRNEGEGPQNQCASAGDRAEGDSCTASEECGAALDCVRAHASDAKGTCRAYCCEGVCGDGADGKPRFCDATRLADVEARVPVCMPVQGCRLLALDQCAADETCAVVRESDGTTGCVEVGNATVGSSCDVEHCAAGLTCLGQPGARTCFQLCSDTGMGAPCPSNQECTWAPPAFNQAGVGVCVQSAQQRAY